MRRRAHASHDLPVVVEGPRHEIVGERRRRADEHIVADRDTVIHADVVLHLAAIADDRLGIDVDVLAENTIAPDQRTTADVGVVPHAGSAAHLGPVLDDRRWMHPRIRHR